MRVAAAVFSMAAGAIAQQSAVIRTETRVVLVDTIVTDKKGDYVRDLAAKDFRLWEDNKEQAIKNVSVEKGAAVSRPRYLVLFFAGMDAADRIAARQAVSGFVDANAEANRMMAVVSYNGSLRVIQNFTDDAGRLKIAVGTALSAAPTSGGDAAQSPDATSDRFGVRARGAPVTTAAADSGALAMIRSLGYLSRNLSVLPGRKTIVLVSGGLPQSSIQKAELTTVIDACNKSDVAVYPIDVRPLSSGLGSGSSIGSASEGAPPAPMMGRSAPRMQGQSADPDASTQEAGASNQQLLFRLAAGTGGFVIPNAGELQRGLQKIREEQGEYYVLSYTPADPKEGACHTLRVKVDRGGTTIRARSNYCESKPQDLLAGTVTGQDLERRAAGAQTGSIAASMQLSYFYLSPNVARVHVAMEIPPDTLKLESRRDKSGKPGAEVNFLGIASASDGGVGARFSDALKLDPESLKGRPLHYEKEFRIAPGRYSFTMAFSSGGETFGKIEAPLAVDTRQAGELAMSGLALSRETHPVAEIGLGVASLAEDRTPLIVDDTQVVLSGSSQFAKSEAGFFYFETYAPDPAAVRVEVRVLDRKTGEPKWDSGPLRVGVPKDNRNDAIPAGSRLPTGELAAGAYSLEVTAVDSAQKQVKRTADFEVR